MRWPPLYRDSRKEANKRRGWIPNFKDGGYNLDYDHLHFNLEYDIFAAKMNMFYGGHPDSGAYAKLHKNVNLDELSPWEKLVIEEFQGRVEYMQHATEENLKSKIQVFHPVQDKERKEKKPIS